MRRVVRRIVLACLVALAAAYPVYYFAANAWIQPGGGLDRLLNRRPDFLRITWRSARTTWPGDVAVEGFELRSQTRAFQWWVALDRGRATIDLPALRRREFRALGLTGEGVRFRLARRVDARIKRRLDPALQPVIPGLSNPPRQVPSREAGKTAGPRRRRAPWRIELAGVSLDGVREVWIEEYRFVGAAAVDGGFDLRVRQRLVVGPSMARIRAGALRRGARAILAGARGRISARILEIDPMRVRGRKVLGWTVGRAEVAGEVGDLSLLRDLIQGARWVELRGGGGPLSADLRLDRGRFAPGSRLEARPRGVGIGFLDYAATGRGRVVWSVEPGAAAGGKTAAPTGRLVVTFDEYQVRREGAARPHVRGHGLQLAATSAAPRADRLFSPISIDLEMPNAVVQDLSFYNSYLPARSGLRLRGGTGRLSGKFRAAAPGWVGTGEVLLVGRRITAEMDGRRLTGDLRLDARLGHADVRERIFDLAGSQLAVTGVTIAPGPAGAAGLGAPAEPNWWGRFHVDRGRLMPGRPVFLTAQVEAMLRDPKPLMTLFLAPERKGLLARRAGRLLEIEGVGATAEVRLGEELIQVDRLAVAGGPAELRGRLRFEDGGREGVLLARYGRLALGLELAGGERQLHWVRPRKWFDEQMGVAGGGG